MTRGTDESVRAPSRSSEGDADAHGAVRTPAQPAAEEAEPAHDAVLACDQGAVPGAGPGVADLGGGRYRIAGRVAAQVAGADEDVGPVADPLDLPGVGDRPHTEGVPVADHPYRGGDGGAVP